MKPALRLVSQDEKTHRTVKSRNRPKEYLTDQEVEVLRKAARAGRHGVRDDAMILLAWKHGLRCEELIKMQLAQANLDARELHVIRVKGSVSTHHPLDDDERRCLKRWLRVRTKMAGADSRWLFLSERGTGLQRFAFNRLLQTIGQRAGFACPIYPHILRHSCGFHLAGQGIDAFRIAAYLGHKNVQNNQRYVHASAHGFRGMWGDE
jgi:type 1 fimbriae regulatory protein FimB